jgi:hypothetical protein
MSPLRLNPRAWSNLDRSLWWSFVGAGGLRRGNADLQPGDFARPNLGYPQASKVVVRTSHGRSTPLAKTVWYRWTAAAAGTGVFSASAFDTVMAVYRRKSLTLWMCNEYSFDISIGASHLPSAQSPGAAMQVTPSDYLIRVGGYYNPGFITVAARNGPLTMRVKFRNVSHNCIDEDCDTGRETGKRREFHS